MAVQKIFRTILIGIGVMALTFVTSCKSREQKALDQAKARAASSNIPQHVQYVDKKGNTITETVEPPTAGSPPVVSTLITPPPPGPKPHSTAPLITAANGSTNGASPAYANGQLSDTQPRQPTPPAAISIPAGTELAIRINQRIGVKTSHAGDHFSGEFVEPILSDGIVIIPRGTQVDGRIDEAHRRGHFKGRSILELRLISMTLNDHQYPLDTHDSLRTKRGKGRRSAGFIGGMTGTGMLIGGIASGGVGLAIGAAAGAGAGTALAGSTGNRDISIPAEAIVHFRLADQLVVQNP